MKEEKIHKEKGVKFEVVEKADESDLLMVKRVLIIFQRIKNEP